MSKYKIYLDTSIISAYYDFEKPVRQLKTVKWLNQNLSEFQTYISSLVIAELNQTPNASLREKFILIEILSIDNLGGNEYANN